MKLHDLTHTFVEFYKEIKDAADALKLEHFWSQLFEANPDFYRQRLDEWNKSGEDVEANLLTEFADFASYQDKFTQLQTTLSQELETAIASFKQAFPDFDTNFDVYFVHSLKSMNGGMRELDGKSTLIFGLDMMARFHAWEDDTPFFPS